jgi:predicted metal-binding membrane protein
MTAAMMVPSSLPLLGRAARSSRAWLPTTQAVFLAGYAAIWTGFAAVAFAGDTLIHWLVDHGTWLTTHTPVIGATTLALAGAYQLSLPKRAWLEACRQPLGEHADGREVSVGAAWRMGLRHGICCLGSGWALMLVMFGIGMGSLAWMAALAGLMLVEKAVPGARRMVPVTGVILQALAILWLLHPAWLPAALA